jgi:hypothetical protein
MIGKNPLQLAHQSLPKEVLELVYAKLFKAKQLSNENIGIFGRLERIDLRCNDVTDVGIRNLALATRGFCVSGSLLIYISTFGKMNFSPYLQFLFSSCVI